MIKLVTRQLIASHLQTAVPFLFLFKSYLSLSHSKNINTDMNIQQHSAVVELRLYIVPVVIKFMTEHSITSNKPL